MVSRQYEPESVGITLIAGPWAVLVVTQVFVGFFLADLVMNGHQSVFLYDQC